MSETPTIDVSETRERSPQGSLPILGLSALGIVFGDIGTSPLYTFKTILSSTSTPDAGVVLGSLSLVLWTLFIITTVKYVTFAMRVDNDGEGGILALMALLGVKKQQRPTIGRLRSVRRGANLWRWRNHAGDLGAVGTRRTGHGYAGIPALYRSRWRLRSCWRSLRYSRKAPPKSDTSLAQMMLVWFVAIALMGISGIVQSPGRVCSAQPRFMACPILFSHGAAGFLVLGAVFLCVTGAEALYADMGHFGRQPIRLAWFAIVFPSLILNYAGQAALVLEGAPTDGNIFFRLCPAPLLIPLIVLATVATIIASQSIITGAFSMTRQAIQLGWLPRLRIKQTSSEGYGQIYVGVVNFLLMIVTIGLTIGFGKSDNLAAAYGIAVSLTMLMTSRAVVHRDARYLELEPAGPREVWRHFS